MESGIYYTRGVLRTYSNVFRVTNFPATSQAMMNKLLRDLINIRKVAEFIDDMIIRQETEEGHDELVAEIIRRLEENDLYVKPEKCKWKVRKVGFLEVVIGPEGERGFGMADTKVCQRCPEVFGIGKLLPLIH